MKKEKQCIRQYLLYDNLLPILKNEIFHVTSKECTEKILKDNFIRGDHSENFRPNYGTNLLSFSRMKKWVAFFDIRGLSEDKIEIAHSDYPFTNPTSLFKNGSKDFTHSFSIFCLKKSSFQRIVNNETAFQENKSSNQRYKYIPKIEVWFPGDCSLSEIERLVEVEFK